MKPSYKHSRLWKDIISIGSCSNIIYNFFLGNCLIKVGNGNRIKFWHDRWCGNSCLKIDFPQLFNLSTDKEGSLYQFFVRKISSSDWFLPHRRVLYAWELAEEVRLLGVLSSAPSLSLDRADYLTWACASTAPTSVPISESVNPFGIDPLLPRFLFSVGWHGKTKSKLQNFCRELAFWTAVFLFFAPFAKLNVNLQFMFCFFAHFLGGSGLILFMIGGFTGASITLWMAYSTGGWVLD
ncbi:hypothetical protein ACSBR1_020721 [Camellia fascicularis]